MNGMWRRRNGKLQGDRNTRTTDREIILSRTRTIKSLFNSPIVINAGLSDLCHDPLRKNDGIGNKVHSARREENAPERHSPTWPPRNKGEMSFTLMKKRMDASLKERRNHCRKIGDAMYPGRSAREYPYEWSFLFFSEDVGHALSPYVR